MNKKRGIDCGLIKPVFVKSNWYINFFWGLNGSSFFLPFREMVITIKIECILIPFIL